MRMRFALLLLLASSLTAAVVNVPAGASLSTALRNAQAGDTLRLANGATYTLANEVGTLRWSAPVTVTSASPRGALLDCSATCYISGAKNLVLRELHIRGRINLDGLAAWEGSGDVTFQGNLWESGDNGFTENLKAAHVARIRVLDNVFWRNGTGARDRLVDFVNVDDSEIRGNAFVRALNGAIQIKGGSERGSVAGNYVLWGGQRAIQIGGSTCWDEAAQTGCWGRRKDGSVIRPNEVGWEAIDWVVSDNVVVCDVSCLSLSTQRGTAVHRNTFYMPQLTGGMYFARFLQEVESQTKPYIQPSRDARIERNAWFYPVTRLSDGKGGVNAALLNWSDSGDRTQSWLERTGMQVDSFLFDANAFYAVTPIVDASRGGRNPPEYPHMHVVGSCCYWCPFDWRRNWLSQIPAGVLDWGLPTMRLTASEYAAIGTSSPVGPSWWKPDPAMVPPPPMELDVYPASQPLYGWAGPGTGAPPVEPDEPPAPVSELFILRLPSGAVLLFDSRAEAEGWLGRAEIERVERRP